MADRPTYIGFAETPARGVWRLFTEPGFAHCYVLREIDVEAGGFGFRGLQIIEASQALGLSVHTGAWDLEAEMNLRLKLGHRFVAVSRQYGGSRYRLPIPGLLFCVSTCKAVLGLRDWRCWSPFRLYRRLIADGGLEIGPSQSGL